MPLTADLEQLAARVSNWGRWGADDQRGTLNLITPDSRAARRRRGAPRAACSRSRSRSTRPGRSGTTSTCPSASNPELRTHTVNVAFTGDTARLHDERRLVPHGFAGRRRTGTRSSHVGYDGKLYNDTPNARRHAPTAARPGSASSTSARSSPAACCSTSPGCTASTTSTTTTRSPATTSTRRPRAGERRRRAGRRAARAHRPDALPARRRPAALLVPVAGPVDAVDRMAARPRRRRGRHRHDDVRGLPVRGPERSSCRCT